MRVTSLLAALPVVALLACNEAALTAPPTEDPLTPSTPSSQTLFGTLESADARFDPITIRSGGDRITLLGSPGGTLRNVIGAVVSVSGTMEGRYLMRVERLVVLAVNGASVTDGIFVRTDSGYAIRLISSGELRPVSDPSAELLADVGMRVRVAGPTDQRLSA